MKYKKLECIGKGTTGTVYKIKCINGTILALKETTNNLFKAQREIEILKKIPHHPNIMKIIDYQIYPTYIYIFTNYIDGIVFNKYVFTNKILYKILYQITHAVAHLHTVGIAHMDIKPSNILISNKGEPYLIDFDLACQYNTNISNFKSGTPNYSAPEILVNKSFTKDQYPLFDIYSLGVTFYTIVSNGKLPFNAINLKELIQLHKKGKPNLLPESNKILNDCIYKMISIDSKNRPTLLYVLSVLNYLYFNS